MGRPIGLSLEIIIFRVTLALCSKKKNDHGCIWPITGKLIMYSTSNLVWKLMGSVFTMIRFLATFAQFWHSDGRKTTKNGGFRSLTYLIRSDVSPFQPSDFTSGGYVHSMMPSLISWLGCQWLMIWLDDIMGNRQQDLSRSCDLLQWNLSITTT